MSGRETRRLTINWEEAKELRRQMADLKEFVGSTAKRLDAETELIRTEVRLLQRMLGELLASLARIVDRTHTMTKDDPQDGGGVNENTTEKVEGEGGVPG